MPLLGKVSFVVPVDDQRDREKCVACPFKREKTMLGNGKFRAANVVNENEKTVKIQTEEALSARQAKQIFFRDPVSPILR